MSELYPHQFDLTRPTADQILSKVNERFSEYQNAPLSPSIQGPYFDRALPRYYPELGGDDIVRRQAIIATNQLVYLEAFQPENLEPFGIEIDYEVTIDAMAETDAMSEAPLVYEKRSTYIRLVGRRAAAVTYTAGLSQCSRLHNDFWAQIHIGKSADQYLRAEYFAAR